MAELGNKGMPTIGGGPLPKPPRPKSDDSSGGNESKHNWFDDLYSSMLNLGEDTASDGSGFHLLDGSAIAEWLDLLSGQGKSDSEIYQLLLGLALRSKSSQEQEYYTNLANEALRRSSRDYDNAYNSPQSQVGRLMAAGMSRTAALQAVQGVESASEPVPATAAGAAADKQNRIALLNSAVGSIASIGGLALSAGMFPQQIAMMKTQAEGLDLANQMRQLDLDGYNLASRFSKAVFAAGSYEASQTGKPFDSTQIKSLASAKDLVRKFADVLPECREAVDEVIPAINGNIFAQERCQRGFDGWVGTKKYNPKENVQGVLEDALIADAMTKVKDYEGACVAIDKVRQEIKTLHAQEGLFTEETRTQQFYQDKLGAETGLIIDQDKLTRVSAALAKDQYRLFHNYIGPTQMAMYEGKLKYYTLMNLNDIPKEMFKRDALDTRFQSYVNDLLCGYLMNPAEFRATHSPEIVCLVEGTTGQLDNFIKYWQGQILEFNADPEVQQSRFAMEMTNGVTKSVHDLMSGAGVESMGAAARENARTNATNSAADFVHKYPYAAWDDPDVMNTFQQGFNAYWDLRSGF